MKRLGYSAGYEYPHDAPGHFKPTQNLPEKLQGTQLYQPGHLGAEKQIADRLNYWWRERDAGNSGGDGD